jgi:GNAT superfamily N-acetyltransferase
VEHVIRPVEASDVAAVLGLVRELADYEREPDAVVATAEDLHAALFGEPPAAHCLVADDGSSIVGFALWYPTFSTWTGKPGLWLEDLYVQPAARGTGLGRGLLVELARIAVSRGWTRFEWWVLDWNEPAQGFYRSVGARPEDDWTVWRVDGDALTELASPA